MPFYAILNDDKLLTYLRDKICEKKEKEFSARSIMKGVVSSFYCFKTEKGK